MVTHLLNFEVMFTMKNISKSLVVFWTAITLLVTAGTSAKAQQQYVDFDVFYNELSPYGNWYNDPDYGYVWQPREAGNFQPYYTNGYWVMTEYGNTWVSNYDWGWAPFHYGRWTMGRMGWIWIPGTQWGPAWVEWRQGGGNYGWAPMAPQVQINISVGGGWVTPYDWFVFVPQRNIYSRNFYTYHRPYNHMAIYNKTIIINNYYNDRNNRPIYNYGPRGEDIRRHTGRNVPVYRVTNAETRSATHGARGNEVALYRPNVRERSASTAPRDVRSYNNSASARDDGRNGSRSGSRADNAPATAPRSTNAVNARDNRREQPATTSPSVNRNVTPNTGTRASGSVSESRGTNAPGNNRSVTAPRTDNSRQVQPRSSNAPAQRNQVAPAPRTTSPAPRATSPAPRATAPAPERSVNNMNRSSGSVRGATAAPQPRPSAPASSGTRAPGPSVNRGAVNSGRSESRPAMNRDARSSDGSFSRGQQGGSRR